MVGSSTSYAPAAQVLTKEQTLQTCRNSSYVLGIRLDENKPKETAAAE